MTRIRTLFVALGLATLASASLAQTDLVTGGTYMWDGNRWIAVNVAVPAAPAPAPTPIVHAPRPVWTPPVSAAVELPTRSAVSAVQPSWLLGVFR